MDSSDTDTVVRVRLSFEDDDHDDEKHHNHNHILKDSQKTEGLKQSWILLKPKQHKTISQLSSYLLDIFQLNHACPHGLILSMDGFVLPPFESTTILKDKDIICVTKKPPTPITPNVLDLQYVLHNQPKDNENLKLLPNHDDDFENETAGYQSENEDESQQQVENESHIPQGSKKRKASKILQPSKKKKKKKKTIKSTADESLPVSKDIANDISVKKSSHKKQKGVKKLSTTPITDGESNDNAKSQPIENGTGTVDASCTPAGTKKVPSRSARRKKAKRRWLREKLKAEREELEQKQQSGNDNHQSAEKDNTDFAQVQQLNQERDSSEKNSTKTTQEHQHDQDRDSLGKKNTECDKDHQLEQNSDSEDNIVPVVVRPGLIRFESLGKADAKHAEQQNSVPLEPLRLNGITSKKKGQKWGLDKTVTSRKKDHTVVYEEYSETTIMEEDTTLNEGIDFEKLKPYAGLPKEGDIIAYRLIELSSLWTPELSPFRVGKISWYKNESNKVLMVTVPEYPIVSDSKMDEETIEPASLYDEDGSLEVVFSSLIDPRILKHGSASSSKSSPLEVNQDNQNDSTSQPQNSNEKRLTPTKEKRPVDPWEEISEALSAKKALLSQETGSSNKNISAKSSWGEKITPPKEKRPVNPWEGRAQNGKQAGGGDNWNKNESSGRRSWSYKALRGSALGPIMSRLRSENGI